MSNQTVFSAALLDGEQPVPPGLIQPDGRAAGKRFDVYRNNVLSSLVDAMVSGFPALVSLLGETYFRALAAQYVRAHPPTTPVVAHYGEGFDAFLRGFAPLQTYPYLGDVARLELAIRSSQNAADLQGRAAERLATIPTEQLAGLIPRPHPSLRLFCSEWPVLAIYAQQRNPNSDSTQAALLPGTQHIQVIRPDMQVMHFALTAEQFFFAQCIDGQTPFGQIATGVVERFPDCDFVSLLVSAVERGTIADFILPEEATS